MNDGSTCYLNVLIQCLSGQRLFCERATEECFSPLAAVFADIIRARQSGNVEQWWEAARELRLAAGAVINPEYADPEQQLDGGELLLLICQQVDREIEDNRSVFGLPSTISFVEREFKFIIQSHKFCPTYV